MQDEACAALLTEWGCDYLQGALIGAATIERPWANPRRPCASPRFAGDGIVTSVTCSILLAGRGPSNLGPFEYYGAQ